MADLKAYTVVQPVSVPHCEEGEHERFAACENCNSRTDGMVPAGPQFPDMFKVCPVCKGTRSGGPSLGPQPCDLAPTLYMPGQTLHLSAEVGGSLVETGLLAAPGTSGSDLERMTVIAAARRLGLEVS